ncbi:MAG: DUF416 family protein [Chlorobi bacterium]|nr:DUF416 family protein [Chlorobiota bacterium]
MLNQLKQNLNSLKELQYEHKIMFAAACCERMLPNYKAFSEIENWGDVSALSNALAIAWQFVKTKDENILELIQQCENQAPDTEIFNSLYTSAALDASNSIVESLLFIVDGSFDHIELISQYAIDTIDMFIQVRDDLDFNSDPLFEKKIYNDELMIKEITKQVSDIQWLSSHLKRTDSDIDFFRNHSNPSSPYSSIGVG